jgi:hypothetical protein
MDKWKIENSQRRISIINPKHPIIAEGLGGLDDGLVSRDRRAIREKIETELKIRK